METKLEITNLITPILNTIKTLSNEGKHILNIGLEDYIQTQVEKYYLTNTFLHRGEKVKFKDIYYPISAKYKSYQTNFTNLNNVLNKYNKITLTGSAGSGKSTLMRYIFFRCVEEYRYIPIFIELRNLNDYNGSFAELIYEKVLKTKLKPSVETFERSLEKGDYLFLLDGYDEIFSLKKQQIIRQIELFVDAFSNNKFIVSTRPGGGIEYFSRFYDFDVLNLNKKQIKEFTNKLVTNGERRKRILYITNDTANNNYVEYLGNPLLLTMFILAFESHPEIPQRISSFYRNVFDTLYSKHDGITKNSFPREKLSKLQRDDFEEILGMFSYISLIEKNYTFTYEYFCDTLNKIKSASKFNFNNDDFINDLRTSISIILLDGFEYSFPHRSLQEYFTVQFIGNLPSEKKSKAYSKLTETLEKFSIDSNFNLWTLFIELDKMPFYKNFLILKLKHFESLLTKNDKKDIIKSYVTITSLGIVIQSVKHIFFKDEHKKFKYNYIDEHFISMSVHANLFHRIVSFLRINDGVSLYDFFERNAEARFELKAALPQLFNSTDPQIIDVSLLLHQNDVLPILEKHHFDDEVNKLKRRILDKRLELESEISQKGKELDDLLDL